jgi:hypothetical protein
LLIFRSAYFGEVGTDELLPGIAEHFAQGIVDVEQLPLEIVDVETIGDIFDDGAVAPLAFGNGFCGSFGKYGLAAGR